jgi:hypothetical protein
MSNSLTKVKNPVVAFLPFELLKQRVSANKLVRFWGTPAFQAAIKSYKLERVFSTTPIAAELTANPPLQASFTRDAEQLSLFDNLMRSRLGVNTACVVSMDSCSLTLIEEDNLKEGFRLSEIGIMTLVPSIMGDREIRKAIYYVGEMGKLARSSRVEMDGPFERQFVFDQVFLAVKGACLFASLYPHNWVEFLQIADVVLGRATIEREIRSNPTEALERIQEHLRALLGGSPDSDPEPVPLWEACYPFETTIIEIETLPKIGIRLRPNWATDFYWLNGKDELSRLYHGLGVLEEYGVHLSRAIRPNLEIIEKLNLGTYHSAKEVFRHLFLLFGLRPEELPERVARLSLPAPKD